MKDYKELDALGRKAREAEKLLNCGRCPAYNVCSPLKQEICDYVFIQGFRKGYNKHKKEVT